MASGDRIEIVGGVDWRKFTPFQRYIEQAKSEDRVYQEILSINGKGVLTRITAKNGSQISGSVMLKIHVDGKFLFEGKASYVSLGSSGVSGTTGIIASYEYGIPNNNANFNYNSDYDLPLEYNGESNYLIITPMLIEFKENVTVEAYNDGTRSNNDKIYVHCKGGLRR